MLLVGQQEGHLPPKLGYLTL